MYESIADAGGIDHESVDDAELIGHAERGKALKSWREEVERVGRDGLKRHSRHGESQHLLYVKQAGVDISRLSQERIDPTVVGVGEMDGDIVAYEEEKGE